MREKIKNKEFHPRARTQLQNRTDPNPYITARSPKQILEIFLQA